ncbi:hypothetical protein AURDEDRAFT_175730 [Auricularia subglabra TFB-10046 SS5]|uniref:MYND-type domain-containing protein n=1 Tax=Auricularia subglabra (strain TFB-10046 / SS5) TaxID=717982 RepID=J0WSR8_AURST|nr:hypothetical protein AURDEDRAFT_175730 [Auricularia subglabra TFB-10046 SS5]
MPLRLADNPHMLLGDLEAGLQGAIRLEPNFCTVCALSVPDRFPNGLQALVALQAQNHDLWDACMRNLVAPRTFDQEALLRTRLQERIDACDRRHLTHDALLARWAFEHITDALNLFRALLCLCISGCLYGPDPRAQSTVLGRAKDPRKRFGSSTGSWPITPDQLFPYGPAQTVTGLVHECLSDDADGGCFSCLVCPDSATRTHQALSASDKDAWARSGRGCPGRDPRGFIVVMVIQRALIALYSDKHCSGPECTRTTLDEEAGRPPLPTCALARYCSRACQRSDWAAGHKLLCRVFAELERVAPAVTSQREYATKIQVSSISDDDLPLLGRWALVEPRSAAHRPPRSPSYVAARRKFVEPRQNPLGSHLGGGLLREVDTLRARRNEHAQLRDGARPPELRLDVRTGVAASAPRAIDPTFRIRIAIMPQQNPFGSLLDDELLREPLILYLTRVINEHVQLWQEHARLPELRLDGPRVRSNDGLDGLAALRGPVESIQ